jgi:integrase/recombinase XerD
MRAFPVRLPSGQRYWTVLDEDLQVVGVADAFLRYQRFGRDGAESTTKAYAHAIALFLRWCARTGRSWQGGVEQFALFMTWLAHAGPLASGADVGTGPGLGVVLAGPGAVSARCPSRINGVLTAVRGMVVHAVSAGHGAAGLVALLYEVADDRDLPEQARGEDGRMAWRMRARHRLREPETTVDRASDEQIVALLRACRSARDRLIVLLMARAGLRRGEVCGLRRGDVHLLVDSRRLGCEVARAHLHVVRREDNPNGAWAKSRRQRVVPLDFLVVQAFDTYEFERMRVPAARDSDFVLVNLFRGSIGAPMRPEAVGELMAAASRRAGLASPVRPHQLRHACGSNVADAGAGIDVVADLLGHANISSSQVYVHPELSRLRAAVDAVPSPREQLEATR